MGSFSLEKKPLGTLNVGFSSALKARLLDDRSGSFELNKSNSAYNVGYKHIHQAGPMLEQAQQVQVERSQFSMQQTQVVLSLKFGTLVLPSIGVIDIGVEATTPTYCSYVIGVNKMNPYKDKAAVIITDPLASVVDTATKPSYTYPNLAITSQNPASQSADIIFDTQASLTQTIRGDSISYMGCKGTKLFDGAPLNTILRDNAVYMTAGNLAVKVNNEYVPEHIFGQMFTDKVFGFNFTGAQGVYDRFSIALYDSYYNRIVRWVGGSQPAKIINNLAYTFVPNIYTKTNNLHAPDRYFGFFNTKPIIDYHKAVDYYGNVAPYYGIEIPEQSRYAIPVTAVRTHLHAPIIKTIRNYPLKRFDNEYTPTTDLRSDIVQSGAKAQFTDFTIFNMQYRYTGDTIVPVSQLQGVETFGEPIPCVGRIFVASTTICAFFYNPLLRKISKFTGSNTLVDMADVVIEDGLALGEYSVVNNFVVMCFENLDRSVQMEQRRKYVVMDDKQFWCEIYLDKNEQRPIQLIDGANGPVFDFGRSFIINDFFLQPYGITNIKQNMGKWTVRADRTRAYDADVAGYIYNPFELATALLAPGSGGNVNIQNWEVLLIRTPTMAQVHGDTAQRVFMRTKSMTRGETKYSKWQCNYVTWQGEGAQPIVLSMPDGDVTKQALEIYSDDLIMVAEITVTWSPASTERVAQQITATEAKKLTFIANNFIGGV